MRSWEYPVYMLLGAFIFATSFAVCDIVDPLGFYKPKTQRVEIVQTPQLNSLQSSDKVVVATKDESVVQTMANPTIDAPLDCEDEHGLPGPCEDMDNNYLEEALTPPADFKYYWGANGQSI